MIYDVDDPRFRGFLVKFKLSPLVQQCVRDADRIDKVKLSVERLRRCAPLCHKLALFGKLTPRLAIVKLRVLCLRKLQNRRVRYDRNGTFIRPDALGRLPYHADVLAHGTRRSLLYFDHLRCDAQNMYHPDLRMRNLLMAYLKKPWKKFQPVHFFVNHVYHCTMLRNWYFWTWVRYCRHAPSRSRKFCKIYTGGAAV